jgi:hypothetical protein
MYVMFLSLTYNTDLHLYGCCGFDEPVAMC